MTSLFGHRAQRSKVAFVAGANGISGGAIIDHLVKEPDSEWSDIIITSRSPIKSIYTDSRVRFVAIDFLRPVEEIVEQIRDLCKNVTHAFFTSYVHDNDFSVLHVKNGPLFRNFLEAMDLACPGLKRVVLQTGGKHYGHQYRDLKTPPEEDMPRYTGPENIFYYEQEDDLFAIQKRRSTWNYNIIRPWGIIGFSWQYLGINGALPIAQYFLICRELGEAPRWPGTLESWHRVDNQSYAPGVADLTIWAATHDQFKDEAFNHVNGDVIVWKYLWHLLAEYFKAPMANFAAPTEETKPIDMAEWAKDKKSTWEKIVARSGGDAEAFQLEAFDLMNWFITPSLQGSPFIARSGKSRDFGWQRSDDTYRSWLSTIRAYENVGVLPMS
ncbi:unnamed protein product [Penicillium salamii]|uniref:PRISE-like Rossmann-fold domain-containing protein n=1 Tax=Penicillium salamii TaxID=1612424 RepID=A0A9W4I6J1_9EURO|nr:unnamed protein product [Penicillium salamii]